MLAEELTKRTILIASQVMTIPKMNSKVNQKVCKSKIQKETWRFLSPPNAESTIIKKWYAVCYQGKRSETLFVAKASRRFLKDKDGPVDSILMKCLKPKIGSGNILEDTPKHLPADEATFSISDVIAGPLEVIPKGATQFIVLCYENVKSKFELVKKIDRTCLVAQI